MIDIQAVQGRTIALGRLGENNYTRILFDVSGWLTDYPSASIGLLNVRPGQTTAYPVSPENLSLSNGVLYWTVTNSDLSAKGTGRCELVAYHGNTIMKSVIFKTMCLEALDGGATPPEPWESWQSFFQALADNAAQSASDAEAAVEHYPRIVDGVWEVWDAQTGAYVSTGVQAQGPKGGPGADGVTFTPAVSPEGVISWTNDGGLPNPPSQSIKGPRGDDYILTAADKEEIAQQAAESLAPALDEKAPAIWEDASGAIATFTDGAEDMPLRECVVSVEPVQSGSGDPSPENVRPITGWTGATIYHSGADASDADEISIAFPTEAGTVYGGTLDVVKGVLTVTWGILDMGARNWTYIAPTASIPYGTFYNTILEKANGQFNLLCEAYPVKAGFSNDGAIQGNSAANTVYITDSRFNGDASALKQSLSGVMLAYALNTPITYTLAPQEIHALLGTNNIWADTGDVAVTYPADTKMFVEQNAPESPVQDVQVDGVSVLSDGVANVPVANANTYGVVRSGTVSVSGTTPTINALPGVSYVCGEVATLDITLPASGCVDVVFESGSTPTVLTVTPPTGVTVKWANGFDPTALEANATYEINIKDGLGVAVGWT